MPTHNRRMDEVRSRWVEFCEIDNVRDLGGLPLRNGGHTRFGVVYRSSTPQQLTEADAKKLVAEIGVRTLIDLRIPDEVEREGYGLMAQQDVYRINLPVQKPAVTNPDAADLVPDNGEVDLIALYRDLLAGSADSIVTAARLVADVERHTVVFHCAAGKDRTGILAAMLLDAVGVPADAIAEDYALTGERLDRVRARLVSLPSYRTLPPVRTGVLGVDPDVMFGFLDHLHTAHGGAATWLRSHGMSRAELSGIHNALVG